MPRLTNKEIDVAVRLIQNKLSERIKQMTQSDSYKQELQQVMESHPRYEQFVMAQQIKEEIKELEQSRLTLLDDIIASHIALTGNEHVNRNTAIRHITRWAEDKVWKKLGIDELYKINYANDIETKVVLRRNKELIDVINELTNELVP